MLGKLLKHEFIATGRIFLPLLALVVAISALTSLVGIIFEALGILETDFVFFLVAPLLVLTGFLLVGAIFTVPLVVVAIRFYKGFLGSEGYLMFTLPVTRHQLVLSKFITAFVWYLATGIVTAAGVTIAVAGWVPSGYFLDSMWIFEGLYDSLFGPFGIFAEGILVVVLQTASLLLTTISSILMVYLAMGLGQLANNYRIVLSIAAFFGIWFATVIVTAMVTLPITLAETGFLDLYYQQTATASNVANIILTAIFCLVMYFGTVYLLNRRLNLL